MKKASDDLTPVTRSRGFTGFQLFAVSYNHKMIPETFLLPYVPPHTHTFTILFVI